MAKKGSKTVFFNPLIYRYQILTKFYPKFYQTFIKFQLSMSFPKKG